MKQLLRPYRLLVTDFERRDTCHESTRVRFNRTLWDSTGNKVLNEWTTEPSKTRWYCFIMTMDDRDKTRRHHFIVTDPLNVCYYKINRVLKPPTVQVLVPRSRSCPEERHSLPSSVVFRFLSCSPSVWMKILFKWGHYCCNKISLPLSWILN